MHKVVAKLIIPFLALTLLADPQNTPPVKRIFLYLDNSSTIVDSENPNSPHLQLIEMITKLFTEQSFKLIQPQDKVEIYTFGEKLPKLLGEFTGPDKERMDRYLATYAAIPSDRTTYLDEVFKNISTQCSAYRDPSEQMVFIIATDLWQDHNNKPATNFDSSKKKITNAITNLRNKFPNYFLTLPRRCHVIVFEHGAPPQLDRSDSKKNAAELKIIARNLVIDRLNGSVIRVDQPDQINYEYNRLIVELKKKAAQPIHFTNKVNLTKVSGDNLEQIELQVENPNWFEVDMTSLNYNDEPLSNFNSFAIPEFGTETFMLDVTNELQQHEGSLELFPVLDPKPKDKNPPPIVINLNNWLNFNVNEVVPLPTTIPSIRAKLELKGKLTKGDKDGEVSFVLSGDSIKELQGMIKGHGDQLKLSDGRLNETLSVTFKDKQIDPDKTDKYKIEMKVKGELEKEVITNKPERSPIASPMPHILVCILAHLAWAVAILLFSRQGFNVSLELVGLTVSFGYNCFITLVLNGIIKIDLGDQSWFWHALGLALATFFACFLLTRNFLHLKYEASDPTEDFQTLDKKEAIYGFVCFLIALSFALTSFIWATNYIN